MTFDVPSAEAFVDSFGQPSEAGPLAIAVRFVASCLVEFAYLVVECGLVKSC